jgi:hypothetical protein
MPFTFSHPAIVLPLAYLPSRWHSLTGLVIGSLVPDFEYFIRMRVQSNYSHTLEGLLGFDLPLGILLAFIFHSIVRDPLIGNAPTFLKARFSAFRGFNWNRYFKNHYLVVVLSILIGAASHVLWDGFTHYGGYFVEQIPALRSMLQLAGYSLPVLKVLQHASTLIGGLGILYAIWQLPVVKGVPEGKYTTYWSIAGFCALVIITLRLVGGLDYRAYGSLIVTAIAGGMIGLVVASLWEMLRQKLR